MTRSSTRPGSTIQGTILRACWSASATQALLVLHLLLVLASQIGFVVAEDRSPDSWLALSALYLPGLLGWGGAHLAGKWADHNKQRVIQRWWLWNIPMLLIWLLGSVIMFGQGWDLYVIEPDMSASAGLVFGLILVFGFVQTLGILGLFLDPRLKPARARLGGLALLGSVPSVIFFAWACSNLP